MGQRARTQGIWGRTRRGGKGAKGGRGRAARSSPQPQPPEEEGKAPSYTLSYEEALETLGVNDNASFEQVIRAKKTAEEQAPDAPSLEKVEAAYDTLLLASLNRRASGEVADSTVKYADVPSPRPLQSFLPAPLRSAATFPSRQALARRGAAFALIASAPIVLSSQGTVGSETAGLPVASGLAATVYFLRNEERTSLPRVTAYSLIALALGLGTGAAMQAALRVDILPFAGISDPALLETETALGALLAASLFLA